MALRPHHFHTHVTCRCEEMHDRWESAVPIRRSANRRAVTLPCGSLNIHTEVAVPVYFGRAKVYRLIVCCIGGDGTRYPV